MTKAIGHFINGAIIPGKSGQFGPIFNPALGEQTGQVALAHAADVDLAVKAAQAAFTNWSQTTPIHRARILFRFKVLIEDHMDELAALVTAEHGKTLPDAMGSIQRGLEVVEFATGIPSHLRGSYTPQVGQGIDSYSLRQPLGVCAGITPFNFPAMVPLWMYPMAIACGNTFILKPSEKDPSVCMRLAELFQQAGLPDGVLNIVNGGKEAVDAILQHHDVEAVSFVGSTPTAQYIYQQATKHHKRVQALGGAKNHALVMPDADLQQTADAIIGAAYGSCGERCMAISAVVTVGNDTADQLIETMQPHIENLKIGPGTQQDIEMGPLVTQQHLKNVLNHVEKGLEEGAKLVVDGRNNHGQSQGFFMGGCLFDQVTTDMHIYQQEIFGPVLCILRAKDFQQALQWVNENPYGNGTALFTRDGDSAREYVQQVQVGMVGINIPIPVPVAYHSFGGWKNSLFGDLHMHGHESVMFYTKLKTVTARWPSGIREGKQFTIPTLT